MKITINNEEVLCNKDFTIQEEMLNTSSVILNNVYPRTWEQDKDYTSRFYYPPDYSKCKIFNEIYHPEEKSTASGTSFTLNNVDLDKQYYIEDLKGQTSQTGTPTPTNPVPINTTTGRQEVYVCGKNLFSDTLRQGVTVYNTGNYSNTNTRITSTDWITLPAGTYTISAKTTYSFTGNIQVSNVTFDTSGNFYNISNVSGLWKNLPFTFTTPIDLKWKCNLCFSNGATITPSQIYDIQVEKGSSSSSYEEYNGTTKEINLGKNLIFLRDNTNTANGMTGTISGNTITISDTNTKTDANWVLVGTTTTLGNSIFPDFIPGETYTLSVDKNISNVIFQINYYKNGTTTQGGLASLNITSAKSLTFTVPNDYTSVAQAFVTILKTATTINETFYIQLEKGSQATTYAPYKTPIELCKIGNYQDKIYKQNGNWYIHKEIGKVVLNGSEAWGYGGTSGVFYTTSITDYATSNNIPMSNYYSGVSNVAGAGGMSTNNTIAFISKSGLTTPRFYIKDTTYTSNTNDLKTWLSTNNVSVYYVLNTPTTTLIEDEELINQLESIRLLSGLNNVNLSSPNLPFIMDLVYNYQEAYTEEDMLFCGVVENTGNISLNPREPHYCNLQVLDFKTFLSEGETLDFVIYEKTILEAIDQVIGVIQPYGFVKGNVNILHGDDVIGAYSTKDKTAYDVFNYLADITQSRWTTRMIDENTVAIDFYDPTLMPQGTAIQYNNTWFCNNNILDMSFSYSSRDYRNKQVMLSGEVYANIETTEVITADGYQTQFNTTDKIGYVSSIAVNGNPATIITKEEYDLGYEGDFYYQPGNPYFESDNLVSAGAIITIVYYAVIEGREVLLNQVEVNKINSMTNRKGVIARYETRNDATTTQELNQIGQSYLKYKGSPEVSLKVISTSNIWNIGERVQFTAPLDELTTEYMVKKKTINYITTQENIFYTFELSSSFNSETEINYFDNQRAKTMGNIGAGEFISRNIDIENTANVVFYDLEVNEVQVSGDSTLQSELQTPLGVE